MSETPRVPQQQVEQPKETADISEEQRTLDQSAKSAPYRDVVERNRHTAALNLRIDKLQSKLDKTEIEVNTLLPENARLKQAHKSMRFSLALSSVAFGVGGSLISQYAASADSQLNYLGWGFVGTASFFVFVKTLFDA